MKLTDYLIQFLEKQGIRNAFGVTGGAACHIFDSLGKSEQIKLVFNHHEQASALSAVASTKLSGLPSLAVVTTGPGGTNTLTGVLSAWQESLPVIFISGQARTNQLSRNHPGIRQGGLQEFDISNLVSPITKFSKTITRQEDFVDALEQAWQEATTGRPGPVWIDIPMDIQWANIDAEPAQIARPAESTRLLAKRDISVLLNKLNEAKKPLLLLGGGAFASSEIIRQVILSRNIPFVTTWSAANLATILPERYYIGRIGAFGQRGANMISQHADLIISLGSTLSSAVIGNLSNEFGKEATIFSVNIDENELRHCTIDKIQTIHADVGSVVESLVLDDAGDTLLGWYNKLDKYQQLNTYDYASLSAVNKGFIDGYHFISSLPKLANDNDCFVADGGGTALFMSYQALNLKAKQKLICSTSICAMGTGLPESIGVATQQGYENSNVICIIGDGSLQFNLHELQTIKQHNLNVKVIIFNNDGYLAIRHTQNDYFNKNYIGSSKKDLTLPEYERVAYGFDIPYRKISTLQELDSFNEDKFSSDGPEIIEVFISPESKVFPIQGKTFNTDGTSTPSTFDNMSPPLPQNLFDQLK